MSNVTTIEPILINAETACKMLSMGRSFFYEQVSTSRIPAPIKIGKKSLWNVEHLRQWANNGCKAVQGNDKC